MRTTGNIIVFMIWLISCAHAQNATMKSNINLHAAKYIELKDIPNHIGDTVCVYGHVHEFKIKNDLKSITITIDSASSGRLFTINYNGAWLHMAKQFGTSMAERFKNIDITAWGVITGKQDSPEIACEMFIPDDSLGTWRSNFSSMVQLQKNSARNPKVRITKVVLAPPPKLDTKEDYHKYFSTLRDVTLSWCDVVSAGKYYPDEKLTELSLKNEVLVLIIKDNIRDAFKTAPETLFLKKQICINGKVIPYKDGFAINITDAKQIEVVGN